MGRNTNFIPIRILPLRDEKKNINYQFTSNTFTLTENIKEDNYAFNHKGTYVVKSSSCMYDNDDEENYPHYGPFVAFNNYNQKTKNENDFFICDVSGSINRTKGNLKYPAYTRNPYSYAFSGPGTYQGGGTAKNFWTTNVITNGTTQSIGGEWIQIKLPATASMYLFKYSILVPNNWKETVSFPKKFMLVANNDAGDSWEFIDQQNLQTEPDVGSQTPIEFNLNTSNKYSCYRLIVTDIFANRAGVFAIKQWAIYGMNTITANREVSNNTETFINMNSYEAYSLENNYSPFSLSMPLLQVETIKSKTMLINKNTEVTDIYIGLSLAILAMGLLIYSNKNK
jgi:hypothetical protein